VSARRPNVAVIVATVLVAVTTIVLASFTAMSHLSERRRATDRLRRMLGAEANQLAVSLALPVWNIDRPQIDKVIDGLQGIPDIEAVVVSAADRIHARRRDEQGQFRPWDGRTRPADLLVEERVVRFEGEAVGTLRVFGTRKFVDAALRRSLLTMICAILLVDLLLSMSVYVVLWRLVLQPLGRIEQYAHAVSAEGAENLATPIYAGVTEELNSLCTSIRTMVELLEQRYVALQRESAARIETQAALRDALDFTDTAIDALTGLFFVVNRDGKVLRRNATLDKLTSDEHRRTMPPLSLVHREDYATARRTIANVFARGAAETELRIKVQDEFRTFHINARRMDLHGESFAVGTGVDITERRQAEAEQLRLRNEIAKSAMEWRETFDTVLTPIVITDRDDRIRRVNRAALELTGLAERELVGRNVEEVGAGEPWTTAAQLVETMHPGDTVATAETRDANGRTWDLSVTHFATTREGDDRFIIVFWEITGIVDLQESLRRSETLSAMGTLIAGVAHEVRNPLFAISATLDAYANELAQPGYEQFHAMLRREVRRLIDLMQELLEYGRPSVLTLERGSVPEVIEAAIESRRPAAHAAGVELDNRVAIDATLLIDRSRLQQVFENLIDNAVQHSRSGGHVCIRSKPREHAGRRWIELRVEDEGSGFPAHELHRVFEPFFTQRDGGTGLGLSIVQRIVEEHAGKVAAGNRDGGGAVVTILLPVADAHVATKVVA
jgi:PAS domain S-box-containing protein